MKQFLFLLFICILSVSINAAAQDSATTKAKADTTEEEWDKNFKREIFDGHFPGGDSAWQKYLEKNLVYPQIAKRKKIQGTVTVQFILDKEGYVSDVEAISGPEELRQSAVTVVKKSPKWLPLSERKSQGIVGKQCYIVFKLNK